MRLRREALALARLRHEGIPLVYDTSATDDALFVAMELVEGESMEAALDGRRLALAEGARAVEQAARIAHFAHTQGFVHRDLKPSNILLGRAGRVHLVDFGVVKATESATLTATGMIVGTPAYTSPEQIEGRSREADARSDVFSLGAVLYHVLTGRPPFDGESLIALAVAIREREPDPPTAVDPRVPRALERIALRALAKAPEDRYPTALALAEALAAWRRGEAQDATTALPAAAATPGAGRAVALVAAAAGVAVVISTLALAVAGAQRSSPVAIASHPEGTTDPEATAPAPTASTEQTAPPGEPPAPSTEPPSASPPDLPRTSGFSPEWVAAWGEGHETTAASDVVGLMVNQAWDVVVHGGYVYVTGNDQARSRGNIDLFVRKYDLAGGLVWEQVWDGGKTDAGFVLCADSAADDAYLYVAGYTREGNINKALLQKRDAQDGRLVWTKAWGDIAHGHHEVDGVAIVGDALYVSHYDATWAGRNVNAVVRRFDKRDLDRTAGAAEPVWTRTWGEVDKDWDSTDGHIYADETGVWITGRLQGHGVGPRGGGDAYLTKVNPDGALLWTRTWGGDGTTYDQGLNLASDGRMVYVAGWTARRGAGGFNAAVLQFGMDGGLVSEWVGVEPSLRLARGVAVDERRVFVAAYSADSDSMFKAIGRTVLLEFDKQTLGLVSERSWAGRGDDRVCASVVADGSYLYLVGRTSRFTDGARRYQPVLVKVSKDSGGSR